ncbi:MAG: hypothetical protein SGI83_02550 [Bacteroidota bacterium]|nr:hypothetical protein [Bacteroidota bacterium]
MRRTLLLLFGFAIFCNSTNAQKNFLTGYIFTSGKDTLRGEIDYRNWEYNPSRITFRSSVGATEQVFTKYELEEFVINGLDRYIKAVVLMDMNPVAINDLPSNSIDLSRMDTVLLRQLVNGDRLNLYEFVDFKSHYFIHARDGKVEELIYKLSIDGVGRMVANNGFRIQLKQFLNNSVASKDQLKLEGLKYESEHLAKFVSALNNPNKVSIARDLRKSKSSTQFFSGGGALTGKLGFTGLNEELNSLRFSRTVSFLVSGGIDLYASRNMQKLFLRTELSVSGFTADGKGTSGTSGSTTLRNIAYTMQQINITPAISVNYSFMQAGTTKLYTGVGLGYNISSYPKNSYTTTDVLTGAVTIKKDFPELKKSWTTVFGRIGVVMAKKIELGLSTQLAGSFIN